MKKILLASASAMVLANASYAADLTGEIGLEFKLNDADKVVAETAFGLSLSDPLGYASIDLTETDGAIVVDGYSVGTSIGAIGLSFGQQDDVFETFSGGLEVVGGTTLADPASGNENLTATMGGAAVMLGITDATEDLADVENVQAAYGLTMGSVAVVAGVDWNMNTEDFTVGVASGAEVAGLSVDGILTYDNASSAIAYELSTAVFGVNAFVDGDDGELLQNVGAGYAKTVGNMTYYAEGAYNLNSEEITPAIGVSFSF